MQGANPAMCCGNRAVPGGRDEPGTASGLGGGCPVKYEGCFQNVDRADRADGGTLAAASSPARASSLSRAVIRPGVHMPTRSGSKQAGEDGLRDDTDNCDQSP